MLVWIERWFRAKEGLRSLQEMAAGRRWCQNWDTKTARTLCQCCVTTTRQFSTRMIYSCQEQRLLQRLEKDVLCFCRSIFAGCRSVVIRTVTTGFSLGLPGRLRRKTGHPSPLRPPFPSSPLPPLPFLPLLPSLSFRPLLPPPSPPLLSFPSP